MTPVSIIHSFVAEHLGGDLDALVDFNLYQLRNKEPYCQSTCGRFDPDDMLITRAIYCVVFGGLWGGVTLEETGEGKLRGETMNSFRTLFGDVWNEDVPDKWNYDDVLRAKRKAFIEEYHKIGNMMMLPDKRINEQSINTHRGCCEGIHDYFDRTLDWLYKLMVEGSTVTDEDFVELFELNRARFAPFCSKEGWRMFVEGNFLEPYVDENYEPVIKSKNFTHWKGGYTNLERYFAECHRYIDDSTAIIKYRGQRIVQILKDKLST